MPIKLSLPTVAEKPDPAVETRAVFVEEWVDSLAYANPPALLDQTLEALQQLNRQPLKPGLRLNLLDLHIRPYAFALDFRRSQEPAQASTALAKQRAVSRRLRLVAVAMALGYKQALSELEVRKSRFGSPKETKLSLQRAVLFSSLALLHSYDEYRPTEPRLWLETIALYKFAARSRLDDDTVPSPVRDPLFSRSVGECFKRLCLTSLVDPYHLAWGELWTVHEAFGDYAELAQVRMPEPAARPAGLFVIDPTTDRKPVPLSQLGATPERHCRVLDANPVLEALGARHRRAGRGEVLASHVLAAMIRALGLPPRRHSPREAGEGKVRIAAGLSTAHHFLGGTTLESRPAATDQERRAEAAVPGRSYRHDSWEIANEGPGGVGILRRDEPQTPLGVGELIGMQFPLRGDGERDWSIGVVRWLNIAADEAFQAGVQTLSETATPVMVYSETVTDTITRIPRPTLALPAVGPEPGNTLVTPRGLFARGNMLRVIAGRQNWLVEALALSESTAAFDRFSYRIVE